MDQGRINRELERDSRNEGSGQQEDKDFTIGQTAELDHKPNIIPKRGRTKNIIQVEDGSDYWEREELQPLEKVQENDIVQNKIEPKEETRIKKLIYIEDPERIQVMGREREKQQKLSELKSQKRVKNLIYIQDPESMQHINLRRSQGQKMSQRNTGKRKVRGPNNIKRHQPKKEYMLRSKHNTKTATVLEVSPSGERVQQAMNEEKLLFDQNKNPSVFAKPNDPNLTANGGYDHQADNKYGGNGYDHAGSQSGRYGYDNQADNQYDGNGYDYADRQCGRYGYDNQADNQYDGNGYDYADRQCGRYGYDHQVDNQYDENGYDHADSQCGRYGYDNQVDNQYDSYGYDHQADYQCSGHECNHRADDHYGGVGVIKQIMKDMGSIDALVAIKGTIFMVMVATYIVNTSGEIIRTTLTHTSQNKTNSLEGVV